MTTEENPQSSKDNAGSSAPGEQRDEPGKPHLESHHRSESSAPEQKSEPSFVRQLTNQLQGWLKDSNPEVHSKVESAIESAAQIADQGLASAKSAVDMLTEFAGDLTGVESFKVIPKSSLALEVDIACKQEQDIVVKQQIAPFIELHALHLGRRIHFEALINKSDKGLQLDIHNGMSLQILAPLIGLQTVEIRGSGLLTRDAEGQLVLVVTTPVPGMSTPATVSLPLKHFIKDVQTHFKRRLSGER